MTTPPPPPRISVFLARESPIAAILRQGPHKRVRLLKWNTETDRVEPGQWFKGRIYAQCCDLSPSGKYFVYWASKEKGDPSKWTAISRPPYLTALKIWPAYWAGGGLFKSESELFVDLGRAVHKTYETRGGARLIVTDMGTVQGNEDLYTQRIQRDGWRMLQRGSRHKDMTLQPPCIYQKAVERYSRTYLLNMMIHGRPGDTEYSVTTNNDECLQLGVIDWADWSHRGDLLFAAEGKIYRFAVPHDDLWLKENAHQITDLNDSTFEEVAPPEWAKQW